MNSSNFLTQPRLHPADRVGVLFSVTCAVHCGLLPVLLAVAPIAGLSWLANARVEWSLIVFAGLVGLGAHGHGYVREHRRLLPLTVFAVGLGMVVAVRLWLEAAPASPVFSASGGLLLASAHWLNARLARQCACCADDSQTDSHANQ